MKKVSQLSWWSVVKGLLAYAGYVMIIIQGIQFIIKGIEEKDGAKGLDDEQSN